MQLNGRSLGTTHDDVIPAKGFHVESRSGHLSFIPAHEADIEVSGTGLSGMTPELLARASALPFKKKLSVGTLSPLVYSNRSICFELTLSSMRSVPFNFIPR